MEPLRDLVFDRWSEQAIVVINSHSDWDHVWGNSTFAQSLIVAHEKTYEHMADEGRWSYALEAWGNAQNGKIERQLPTLTFRKQIAFPQDRLILFHTPGHTVDSSSLWDEAEGILFVGDNLERPLPYLQSHDFAAYSKTLQFYLELKPKTIVTSHSGIVDEELVKETIDYIEKVAEAFSKGRLLTLDHSDEAALALHQSNLQSLVISRVEERAKEKWGEEFSTKRFIEFIEENESDVLESLEGMLLAALC